MKTRILRRLAGTAPASDPEAEARAVLPSGLAAVLFPEPLVPAAVLIPLVSRPAGLTVLLTRRTDHLRDHPGQISLPGGRIDARDAGPLSAAIRELDEELGVPAHLVEVAGYLPVHPVVTGFVVTPVVGFLPDALELRPDSFEVAEVFEVPLGFFLDAANALSGRRLIRGIEVPVWEYRYGAYRVWGATAHILKSFQEIIHINK